MKKAGDIIELLSTMRTPIRRKSNILYELRRESRRITKRRTITKCNDGRGGIRIKKTGAGNEKI
jgi:hypothetical protein